MYVQVISRSSSGTNCGFNNQGLLMVGGFGEVIHQNKEHGRLILDE
jgi:hypothetical protein